MGRCTGGNLYPPRWPRTQRLERGGGAICEDLGWGESARQGRGSTRPGVGRGGGALRGGGGAAGRRGRGADPGSCWASGALVRARSLFCERWKALGAVSRRTGDEASMLQRARWLRGGAWVGYTLEAGRPLGRLLNSRLSPGLERWPERWADVAAGRRPSGDTGDRTGLWSDGGWAGEGKEKTRKTCGLLV